MSCEFNIRYIRKKVAFLIFYKMMSLINIWKSRSIFAE